MEIDTYVTHAWRAVNLYGDGVLLDAQPGPPEDVYVVEARDDGATVSVVNHGGGEYPDPDEPIDGAEPDQETTDRAGSEPGNIGEPVEVESESSGAAVPIIIGLISAIAISVILVYVCMKKELLCFQAKTDSSKTIQIYISKAHLNDEEK
jgi:hypothetical protein